MRVGGEPVGRWGLAVMAVTGITGLVLALHGWSDRGARQAPPLAGAVAGRATPASSASAIPPGGPASSSPAAAAPSAQARPLLSSEPFAKASFQIWPGPVTSAARLALTGLTVTVHKRAGGISVTAGVSGQGQGSTKVYAGGARVYVIEASLGDDSGNADYNLGDDGLVITDAQGRIIQ